MIIWIFSRKTSKKTNKKVRGRKREVKVRGRRFHILKPRGSKQSKEVRRRITT
jgi:hypothetical protein